MPSSRPQAAFEPIAPGLHVKHLVETTPNFEWATRIHCDMIDHHGLEQFDRLVLVHVVLGGKPLVIEGYETRLDRWTFAVQWLRDNYGQKVVDVRELNKDVNVPMTMEHYLKHMAALSNQWTETNYKEEGRQRMYLKDMDCPQIWHDKLKDHIPLGLFYLNDGTGDIDGFGAVNEPDPSGAGSRTGRGVAKSGDLMSSLPKEMRAENLMCYIGHEGTYTPAHREMCASLGHNIMVEASPTGIEDGKMTKTGSSLWFMTETREREVVSEYWLSRLGHDIEIEKHFAQLNAWKHAPFKTYVVEQKPGDFILIPPLAPHQVWNRGTRTMKVAWNRTTVETLEMALDEALYKARFVCRDEQYKNKAIIYYTVQKYSKMLKIAEKHKRAGLRSSQSLLKVRQLEKDFKRLHQMFTKILVSESFSADKPETMVEMVPFDSNITCSYCRCNIFNRFLTCPSCIGNLPNGDEDTYDICMECYSMGRSCACISKLNWVEQFDWNHLTQLHDSLRKQILSSEQKIDSKSPKSLKAELDMLRKQRTLAQICQVELTRRPWHDISKDPSNGTSKENAEREEEVELDINGNVKKTKKKIRRSEKYVREHGRCHVDCYWEPKWKQAHCNHCNKNYCYGLLFRAYDMMPQDIMANPDWKCPSCRKICGCRVCRNHQGYKKYTPKGTLLGHNTKAVADARSVESLVDFSHSNIAWIQKAGDDHDGNTLRLRRRQKDAELAKAQNLQLGDDYVNEQAENVEERILRLAQQEGIPIDPALAGQDSSRESADNEDEDEVIEHPEVPRRDTDAINDEGFEPERWVPEGGVMFDSAHAYENTDAITYVYPDPIASTHLPPLPAEGYTPIVPGYEEAVPGGPGRIEMIDRKRKRAKLDEGDRPYHFKKAQPKSKAKVRKSLVVKLTVNKEKLAEIERAATAARRALEDSAAPVVGSDLQALNVDYDAPDVSVSTKNVRPEEGEEEDGHDDEFTPGRYRDRRRPMPDGSVRQPPDIDITRRTTRLQTVTYADPSDGEEEEFDEVVLNKSRVSKLATMEGAVQDLDGVPESRQAIEQHNKHTQADREESKTEQPLQPAAGVFETVPQAKSISVERSQSTTTQMTPIRLRSLSGVSNSASSSSPPPPPSSAVRMPSKALAEAQANRRAKMAVIEGDNTDSGSDGSDGEESSDRQISPPTKVASSNIQSKPLVGSKTPRLSLPSTSVTKEPAPTPKPNPKLVAMQRASAADWGDSSSDEDDDISFAKAAHPTNSRFNFPAINVPAAKQVVKPTGRKRGRPAKAR